MASYVTLDTWLNTWISDGPIYGYWTTTKESNKMYKAIDLAHQTGENRKLAADEAKRAAKARKATAQVETHLYGSVPVATLTLQNDAGQTGDDSSFNPRYMSVRLHEDDLEKLQDAVYAARVELHKHSTKLKNPGLGDLSVTTAW